MFDEQLRIAHRIYGEKLEMPKTLKEDVLAACLNAHKADTYLGAADVAVIVSVWQMLGRQN